MRLLIAHHEVAATATAWALGASGVSVAVLWRASTGGYLQRWRARRQRGHDHP